MATIVDSYSESNTDAGRGLCSSVVHPKLVAQSFTGSLCKLSHIKVQLYADNAITDGSYIYARIYSHSGTYGTSSVCGDLLATSDGVASSGLPTFANKSLFQFNFSGDQRIVIRDGINYCLAIYFNGGDSTHRCIVCFDQTSPSHSGNMIENGNTPDSTKDLAFYVYGEEITPIVGKKYPLPPFRRL